MMLGYFVGVVFMKGIFCLMQALHQASRDAQSVVQYRLRGLHLCLHCFYDTRISVPIGFFTVNVPTCRVLPSTVSKREPVIYS